MRFLRRSTSGAGHQEGGPPHRQGPDLQRLNLLASALAGRALNVAHTTGSSTYTDGSAVFLARAHPSTELGSDDVLAVCVQSTLVGIGSLAAAPARRIKSHPEVGRRFLTLEARRAVAVHGRVLPPGVVAAILEHWNGAPPTDADASVRLAIDDLSVPEAPSSFGSIMTRALPRAVAAPLPSADPDLDGSDAEPEDEDDEDDDEEAARKPGLSPVLIQAPFENPMSKLMQRLMGGKSRSDDTDGGGDSGVKSAVAPKGLPSEHARVVAGRPLQVSVRSPKAVGYAYPEWDGRQGQYRPDWCRVVSVDPALRTDSEGIERHRNREVTRGITRLALAYERHTREVIGDSLDVAALVDFQVSRTMGATPDGDVFQSRRRTANDLSALVLLDCSGSGAETSRGVPIWEQQRNVAAELVGAFEHSGSRVALYGFNSLGRQVRFLRVKSFNDRFGPNATERLIALQPAGFTRMGAAVRHATSVLDRHGGTARQLLVVISDGFPYDDDYEGDYAQQDTTRALEEARAKGVGCACFTIGSSTTDDALAQLWGSTTHARLPSGAKWARPIEPTLRQALAEATSVARRG